VQRELAEAVEEWAIATVYQMKAMKRYTQWQQWVRISDLSSVCVCVCVCV